MMELMLTKSNWIPMPAKDQSRDAVETIFTKSERISKRKGGIVSLNTYYYTAPLFGTGFAGTSGLENLIQFGISASLEIPPYAFNDESNKIFSLTIDEETCSATFEPSPFTFDKPLVFNLVYYNLDLSKFDLENLEFAYIGANGHLEIAEYDELVIDVQNGTLGVTNAKIPHFSRFGFVN